MAKVKNLTRRDWVAGDVESYILGVADEVAGSGSDAVASRIDVLIARNRQIHQRECFNLNPATNVMNPRAEAALAAGLGSRPSLGYPGDKYEMGLEAIGEIEIIAAELAAEIFQAKYAEIRVASGAMANLYGFMATCKPGDGIIAPPASIGGHVTHHAAGCAGLYGLAIHPAPRTLSRFPASIVSIRKSTLPVRQNSHSPARVVASTRLPVSRTTMPFPVSGSTLAAVLIAGSLFPSWPMTKPPALLPA